MYLEVEGDGQYFFVMIVLVVFEGKWLIQWYQFVYVVFGDCMKQEIYVFSMKMLMFVEWQNV